MALEFNSIQPIRFGDFESTPKLTTSVRMRIQQIKFDDDMDDAISQLSAPFGKDSEKVAEFIKTNMSQLDVQRLQAYLVGGDSMLDTIDKTMDESIKKSLEGANNG